MTDTPEFRKPGDSKKPKIGNQMGIGNAEPG
jgi:hypothetical protein